MQIISNPCSFFELIARHNLSLPTSFEVAHKIQTEFSSRPNFYFGVYDFTDDDQSKLHKLLDTLYKESEVYQDFVPRFATRFLNYCQQYIKENDIKGLNRL
ncbi:hypothetical protein D3C76_130700 [compost metagenome]